MCEKCVQMVEETWEEIRDLMEFGDGPESTRVKTLVKDTRDDELSDEDADAVVTGIRCQLMAERLAIIVSGTPNGRFHGAPPSAVLEQWRDHAARIDAEAILGSLAGILGSGVRVRVGSLSDLLSEIVSDDEPTPRRGPFKPSNKMDD